MVSRPSLKTLAHNPFFAMTAPSHRMVLLVACAVRTPSGGWDGDAEVLPVLALAGRMAPDAAGIEFECVVNDSDYGVCLGSDLVASNVATRPVFCDWPPHHDAEQLRPHIARVKAEALQRAASAEKRCGRSAPIAEAS